MNCLPLDLQRVINSYLPDKDQYNEVLKEFDELYTDSIYYGSPMPYLIRLQSDNRIYTRDIDILIDRFNFDAYTECTKTCTCKFCF